MENDIFSDLRFKQANKLLHQLASDWSSQRQGVKGPVLDKKAVYEELIQECSRVRGANIYFPYLGSGRGVGSYVELADGSVKLDMINGIGVHYFGHGSEAFREALLKASLMDTLWQGNLQQNINQVELMQGFLALAQQKKESRLAHCFLSTSGAMANENALKMAFQKQFPANRVLAFRRCFTGRSIALAQITDKALYRDGLPTAIEVDYIDFYDGSENSIDRSLEQLKAHLKRFPGQYAVCSLELIQGEGGYYAGDKEFFENIFRVLKEAGILIWVDEVQSFGRTREPFAFQYFGLDEWVDLVTIGKMSQVCATFFTHELQPRPGLISQTFTATNGAIECAKVVVGALSKGGLCGAGGRIEYIVEQFHKGFASLAKKYQGQFSGPWGCGGMLAFTYGDGCLEESKAFCKALFDAGLIVFLAGSDTVRIRLLPALAVVSEEEIDVAIQIIDDVLSKSGGKS